MTPKLFKQINEFLADLIYSRDTSEALKQAAKNARRALFRYRDGDAAQSNPKPLHNSAPHGPASCADDLQTALPARDRAA